jgi:uncharacterized protein YbjT (DUF2867 family)
MKKTAAVVGATGLIGRFLVDELLADNRYEKVVVYARSSAKREHPKLEWQVGDLFNDSTFGQGIDAHDIFCAIGTTRAKTSDLATYKNIDLGIPVRTAEMGLKGQMTTYSVVSSIGANADSGAFYTRIKGQMEKALLKMPIPNLYIFRPSFILGPREEFRFGEEVAKFFAKALKPVIPKKYRGIEAEVIAKAMIKAANSLDAPQILESHEIEKF